MHQMHRAAQVTKGFITLTIAALIAGVSSPASAQATQAGKAKLDDPTIVAIFDAANTWDIQTGKLAEKKGTTKEVRDFGAMLARDHTTVRQQGRDLAKKLNVTPTPPKDFGMAKDLEHEVGYHKAVIDAVTTTLLPALQNAEVKDLVTKVAPAFQAHMLAAQNMLDKAK